MARRSRRHVRIVLALALTACSRGSAPVRPDVVELAVDRFLPSMIEAGGYVVAGWTAPSADDPRNQFAVTSWDLVDPLTGGRTRLALPAQGDCTETEYSDAFRLGDYEVGFSRQCRVKHDTGEAFDALSLVGYDLLTKRVRTLADPFTYGRYVRLGDGDILVSNDSSFCSHLTRYRNGKRVPLGITLAEDGWPLDLDSPVGATECREHGLVSLPAVSAMGELAFMASPAAKGKGGTARVDAEAGVHVVGTDGVARRIAVAPGHPRELEWAADGQSLLLSVDRSERPGLYAVARDGRLTLLTSDVANAVVAFREHLVVLGDGAEGSLFGPLYRLPKIMSGYEP